MAKQDRTLDIHKNAHDDEAEKYPLFGRIYGVVSIVSGVLQIDAFVRALLAVFFGRIDLANLEEHAITTIVIGVVALLLSAALAVLFVVLGVRLLRGLRHKVALVAAIMIALEALVLVCHFMLTGLSGALVSPAANMVVLIALQSYSDPALRQERRLQRHLRELEWKAEGEEGTLGRDQTGRGYITLNFFNVFWVFVVCCFLGLVFEVIWHMVVVDPGVYQDRAGLLYGPFSPIYGFGAVLMTLALNRFYNKNPLVVFLVSAVIGGAFEFFVSWFMQVSFGIVAWDYSGTFMNICGRTNLFFMCIWGALGLVWVRFGLPFLLRLVNRIPWNWRYAVTSICALFMAVDCVLTLASFDCWFMREGGTMNYQNPSAIVQFCNEHYDNEFMAHRFQSMTIRPENASRA